MDPYPGYLFPLENYQETERLIDYQFLLDKHLGLFPERPDLSSIRRVLDLGCGPGLWACEVAQVYPHLAVFGMDLSLHRIATARRLAEQQGLFQVQFEVMDLLERWQIKAETFDLVNLRLAQSYLRLDHYQEVLRQAWRVLRPGGVMRLTECENTQTTSPTLEQLSHYYSLALHKIGLGASPDGRQVGITVKLPWLLRQAGFMQVEQHASVLEWSVGTQAHAAVVKDLGRLLDLLRPFFSAVGFPTFDIGPLREQALLEMEEPEFCAHWFYLTVCGRKPCSAATF